MGSCCGKGLNSNDTDLKTLSVVTNADNSDQEHKGVEFGTAPYYSVFPSNAVAFPTQWSSVYGNASGGGEFGQLPVDGKIDGIRLWGGSLLDAIQIRYEQQWSDKRGGSGGGMSEYLLKSGEFFKYIEIWYDGGAVRKLRFITNYNNVCENGSEHGSYISLPGSNEAMILNIRGRSGDFVDSIQFLFGPAIPSEYR